MARGLRGHGKIQAILLMQIFPSSIPLWGQEVVTQPEMASLIH